MLAVVYGGAIVGGAFILAWAAEAAQVDISAGLAVAILAFLAVLPEYAVDFVFTFRAGQTYGEYGRCTPPGAEDAANPCSLALANMTGANRILVGVGWPLVVVVAAGSAYLHRRKAAEEASVPDPGLVRLERPMSVEVTFLGIATLYSLTLPLKTTLTIWDAVVLVGLFAAYAWRIAKAPPTEPYLLGVSAWAGELPTRTRRTAVVTMFVFAAGVILLTAEHFAESIVGSGDELGVSRFLLVQWAAPLASESPELIVACLYAWRLQASDSLGTLLSSKVNQWTLLVGTIPTVFALTAFGLHGLPLDANQRQELLITAAQSLFAVAVLIDLRLSLRGAGALIALFGVQFVASITLSREANELVIYGLSAVYIALAVVQLALRFGRLRTLAAEGTVVSFEELERRPHPQDEEAR